MELQTKRQRQLSRRAVIGLISTMAIGGMAYGASRGNSAQASGKRSLTGADRLAADGFSPLSGKRAGLVTNHTGRIGRERLIDVMVRTPGVKLAAILTPEHGLSGSVEAGAKVAGGRDSDTGIPVLSLYGQTQKPTPAMLAGLDILVFDMQDIGTRFYTYISTMGLAMQAAAEAGLPFVVLDRPNPLGGSDVSGYVLEKPFASFVGRYEIPIVHGLTVGELARMVKGERLLPGLERLALDVVAMDGWRRSMRWPETGLPWLATSPNIPTFETALAYAGTGLFEATAASEGRGTDAPFLTIGHPSIDAVAIAARLAGVNLPGARLDAVRFTPRPVPGVATAPRFAGREIAGLRLSITDVNRYQPVETGIHLLAAVANDLAARGGTRLVADSKVFNRLAGTARLAEMLGLRQSADAIIASWQDETAAFKARRAPYLIYS